MPKQIFFNSSFFLICFFSITLVVSNVAFLSGFDLNIWNTVIAFFISVFILGYTLRNTLDSIVAILLAIIILLMSYFAALHYFDTSWDGQGYHQETIYLLKKGWNPLLEESRAFHYWIDIYQKGNEIIQANIYLITNKIEAGKMLNVVLVFIAFFVFSSFLDTLELKKIYKIFISFIAVFNPIVFTQIFTYYVDGNWYLTLLISLSALLTYFSDRKLQYIIIFVLSSVTFCSLKFSSIPIFMVFAGTATVYHLICHKKLIFIPYLYILLFGFFCNIHPFITNVQNGNHLLHPFVGEKKMDIINQNIPELLLNRNRAERTLVSLFSKTNNDFRNATFPDILKLPFTFSKDELFINFDTRLGGFGFLFSGVLVLTFLLTLYLFLKKNTLNKKILVLVLFAFLVSVIINPASWWSRLSAQIWLIPIVFIIFGLILKNKKSIVLSEITLVILIVNVLVSGGLTALKLQKDNEIVNDFISSVGDKTIILDLSNKYSFKQYYLKFEERNIKYKIVKIKDKSHLAPFTPDVYYKIE